jgi:hypothetical protein
MSAHQILKHINVPIPDARHKGRVGILGKSDIRVGTGLAGEKIQRPQRSGVP